VSAFDRRRAPSPPHSATAFDEALHALQARAAELPDEQIAVAFAKVTTVASNLAARLVVGATSERAAPCGDRLLAVEQAAAKLAVKVGWLYRHANRLPFTVRQGRLLRFSERGIEKYIAQRCGS
jgi:predicted DNA-binding transcriptional regulator AlpA